MEKKSIKHFVLQAKYLVYIYLSTQYNKYKIKSRKVCSHFEHRYVTRQWSVVKVCVFAFFDVVSHCSFVDIAEVMGSENYRQIGPLPEYSHESSHSYYYLKNANIWIFPNCHYTGLHLAVVRSFIHLTYSMKQWAAVSTMSFLIRNPPQKCFPLFCTEAMNCNEFGGTSFPSIISPPSA